MYMKNAGNSHVLSSLARDRIRFLLVVVFLVIASRLRRIRDRRRGEALSRLDGQEILHLDDFANFFGQQTLGASSPRGNCILLITSDRLIVELWVPARTIEIDLTAVQSVETTRTFLRKSVGRRLLLVNFQLPGEAPDAIGLYVRSLDSTVQKIQNLSTP